MEYIILIILWIAIYNILYSPKARIRIILRQINRMPLKVAKAKRKMPDEAKRFDEAQEIALNKRHKMLDALLSYYFDPEKDKEYIDEVKKNFPPYFKS
jgi:hypothetical protein